ncbi:hypothetical protein GPL15_15725 [Clostridium sp. MCC353]|uniref:acyl carrier protein n=1 Tax=Clostridium sp. MCC353 TaxID=2592646 RepID=UPI001C0355E4|nr:acyl carrier protein [Clostridium sp. MCC353]MBT9777951.1 hypothetical protein [Clostridium sp. MCC353]
MPVKETIIQLIDQKTVISVPITETTDLYKDLYLDSLSFVCLLMDIEEQYHITIDLPEMAGCRIFGTLIKLVEEKVKKKEEEND